MIPSPFRRTFRRTPLALLAAVSLTAWASAVSAQDADLTAADEDPSTVETAQLGRDASELRDHVAAKPVDRDFLDTAMIFSNGAQRAAGAYCNVHDRNGDRIGRFFVRVPGKGLRFVLASDASRGADFVGSVSCSTRGDLTGSALLLGAQVTDLPTEPLHHSGQFRLRFPVVATY